MNAQLSMFDVKPIEHRKQNGQYGTRLEAALDEARKWKALYTTEITRQNYVSRKMRLLEEENIRLKKENKNP
jgi:hypothetical protein